MPSRRFHTKTRHGCTQCKARRVKCDGQTPVCGNCQRIRTSCGFSQDPAHFLVNGLTSTHITRSVETEQDSLGLNVQDLGLMHHYTTVVSLTLSDRSAIQNMWQMAIPKEALAHPFLLHGIPAISALHLAHNDMEMQARYRDLAIKHYNVVLRTFRPLLGEITSKSCHTLFAASSLVAVFALALPQTPGVGMLSSPIEEIVKIFELGRGVYNLVQNTSEWIKQGSLSPLLQMGIMKTSAALPKDASDAISRLHRENSVSEDNEDSKRTNFAAITILERAFNSTAFIADDAGLAIVWLILVNHDFIDALKRRQPMALTVLAHYGVVLHKYRQHWWCRTWGSQLVGEIQASLGLEKRDLMQWPAQRVGVNNI